MKNDVRDILVKDLCGRLPYGVKVEFKLPNYETQEFDKHIGEVISITKYEVTVSSKGIDYRLDIDKVKPYLFSLYNLSKDQIVEASIALNIKDYRISEYGDIESRRNIYDDIAYIPIDDIQNYINWLDKNMFDYRGLLEKDAAINAKDLNVYN